MVGFFTGSISILSEAIHSIMDLLASFISYYSVKIADTPADKEHNYGHGKFENISGVIEGLIIISAALWILFESVGRISTQKPIEKIGIGFFVMILSGIINLFVSNKLKKASLETESVALEADALHLKTDVYSSIGVSLGLLAIWITGITLLDSLVAMVVALFILREAFLLLKNAFSPLLDSALSDSEIEIIQHTMKDKSLHFHNLKTRKAGKYRFADFHLELPDYLSLKEVHDVCDEIESILKQKIRNLELNIHVEPIEKIDNISESKKLS